MNRSSLPARRRPWALGLAGSLAVGGLVLAPTVGAEAAPSAACPDAFPVTRLSDGTGASPLTTVTGKASTHGTTPDAITGSYVGTVEDAVGPGKDLLIFKLAGSRITHQDGSVDAGIWAGMSGSPLYADSNGDDVQELVGAVSYGFSVESSDYAGVTPAADVYGVDKRTNGASSITVPRGLARTMSSDGVSDASLERGLRRLPVPRAVYSGLSRDRLGGIARKTGFSATLARAALGSRVSSTKVPLQPGGSVATSYSYGAVSYTGVGTVTAICGTKVYAFGHPDSYTGPSTLGMHGATPVFVQRDNARGSSIVANVAAPVGQITQDRASGIMGVLSSTQPGIARVWSRTQVVGYGTRTSETRVTVADALAFVADAQAAGETDTLYDGLQPGTASVTWVIIGKRANGSRFQVSGTNKVADRYDISGIVGADATTDIFTIAGNEFEDARITDVRLSTVVTPRYDAYRIGTVQAKQRGGWRAVSDGSRVKVKPGKRVRLRVSLVPQRGSAVKARTVPVSFKVPRRFRGEGLLLEVAGLADRYGSIEDEELVESSDEELSLSARSTEPTSFPGLLTALRGNERNDQLLTTLYAFDEELEEVDVVRQQTVRAPSVVSGDRTLFVKVKR